MIRSPRHFLSGVRSRDSESKNSLYNLWHIRYVYATRLKTTRFQQDISDTQIAAVIAAIFIFVLLSVLQFLYCFLYEYISYPYSIRLARRPEYVPPATDVITNRESNGITISE